MSGRKRLEAAKKLNREHMARYSVLNEELWRLTIFFPRSEWESKTTNEWLRESLRRERVFNKCYEIGWAD